MARVAAPIAVGLLLATPLAELKAVLKESLGEDRLGSVRLGEGRASETGEELVNG